MKNKFKIPAIISGITLISGWLAYVVFTQDDNVLYGLNENSYPPYNNAAFIDSLKILDPDIIRYPCGKCTDSSDWMIDRPLLPELAKAKNEVGFDVLFVLNMNTSTLDYEMQMLDSANRLGIPIKYIEFGNEVNNIDNPLKIKFNNSGAEYGMMCKLWSDSIRAKYPGTLFGAWAENKKDQSPTWNADLLSVYKPDAQVSHIYPDSGFLVNGQVDTAKLGRWVTKSFIRSGISFDSIPVWITEYNVNPRDLAYFTPNTHRQALVEMTKDLENLGCQMLIMHSLAQGENCAINVSPNGLVQVKPTGKAFMSIKK